MVPQVGVPWHELAHAQEMYPWHVAVVLHVTLQVAAGSQVGVGPQVAMGPHVGLPGQLGAPSQVCWPVQVFEPGQVRLLLQVLSIPLQVGCGAQVARPATQVVVD